MPYHRQPNSTQMTTRRVTPYPATYDGERIAMYFLVEIVTFIIVHILALFYGCLVLLKILWTVVRHPLSLRKVKRFKVPECLINHEFGEHRFIKTPSKMVFHYVAKGGHDKPLMLCLHGYPEFWYSWRYQLQGLSEDYRVIAMDLRGYGETDRPKGRSMYTMDKVTQDIKEFISSLGYSSCILVCHDMGGYIGWTLAHQHPELVDKLILLSCPHPMCADKYTITHPSQLMIKSWFVFFFQLPYLPELWICLNDFAYLNDVFRGQELGVRRSGAITDEDIEAYKYAFGRKGALTPPLNYFRNLLNRPQGSHVIYYRRFRKPVLIIWGTGDGALESGMLEGTERFAPNLTIRYVDGASHWVQQEEPEIVNDCIHDFLTANSYEMVYQPE